MAQGAYNKREKVAHSPQDGRYCRIAINQSSSFDDKRTYCPYPQIDRIYADSKVFFNGIGFCSLSEAALSALLEVFVPGFKTIEGITFQVPLGEGRSIDFYVNGVVIEYHQPRLHPEKGKNGDYPDREDYAAFIHDLKRAGGNSWKRQKVIETTRLMLYECYYSKRRVLLDNNPSFTDAELIVATSREDFYRKVILRFVEDEPPSLGEFIARFWWWVNLIARQNGLPPLAKDKD